MNEGLKVFASRLQLAMNRANINQVELAKAIGVSHATISRYLSAQLDPRTNRVASMAKVLDVNPAWLYGFGDRMTNDEVEKRKQRIDYLVSLPDEKLELLIEIAERMK